MYKNAYHGGPAVEIFATTGKDPLKNFKIDGSAKNVQKVFDKQMKGSIYTLDGTTTKIQTPPNERDNLHLLQPFLVFQIYIPQTAKNLKIEIAVTDTEKTKRRLIFHQGAAKGIVTNPLHARIPTNIFLKDQWLNLSFDVFAFAHYCFKGVNVKTIDLVSVTSNCKLRKIFSMRAPLKDDEMDMLEPQLNQLTMDEFCGDMSQILFEDVPHNLQFAHNSCQFRNQFIFPHRIVQQDVGASQSLEISGTGIGPSKAPKKEGPNLAFGRVLPKNDKNVLDRKRKSNIGVRKSSQQKLDTQLQKQPAKSIMKTKDQAEEKAAIQVRQVQFMETRENTFAQPVAPVEEFKKEESKIEEPEEMPGQMYDAELRMQYIKDRQSMSNPWDLQGRKDMDENLVKKKPFQDSQQNLSDEDTTQNSDFKIHNRRSTGSTKQNNIEFNLHEDESEDQIDHSQPEYSNCFSQPQVVAGSLRQKALERKQRELQELQERNKKNDDIYEQSQNQVSEFKLYNDFDIDIQKKKVQKDEEIETDIKKQFSAEKNEKQQNLDTSVLSATGTNVADMQKTNGSRFTSIKKGKQNIQMNKFSSSGVGNFGSHYGNPSNLPPFSPTPTAGINVVRGRVSEVDGATDMIEQTNEHFVEFDLGLNNEEQYNDSASDQEDAISENIVSASSQSNVLNEAQQKMKENVQKKIEAKLKITHQNTQQLEDSALGSAVKQPKFGTQIVNYQPEFGAEDSDSDENITQGKRTFTGKNFAALKEGQQKFVPFTRGNPTTTDPSALIENSMEEAEQGHDESIDVDYARLKSNRQKETFKAKNLKRKFSPPIKMTQSRARNYQRDVGDSNLEDTAAVIDAEQLKDQHERQNASNLEDTQIHVNLHKDDQAILETSEEQYYSTAKNFFQDHNIQENTILEADETIIHETAKKEEKNIREEKLLKVTKVNLCRDSLDDTPDYSSEMLKRVEAGELPKQMFCVDQESGEMMDVEFDEKMAKCYFNRANSQYYRPVEL